MSDPVSGLSPLEDWLAVEPCEDPLVYRLCFEERHLGNPLIRSIHGGVVGTLIEYTAEAGVLSELRRSGRQSSVHVTATAIDYLRVTKDAPLYAKCEIVRVARRIAFVDVWCWQDEEELPVTRGSCTLRIVEDD